MAMIMKTIRTTSPPPPKAQYHQKPNTIRSYTGTTRKTSNSKRNSNTKYSKKKTSMTSVVIFTTTHIRITSPYVADKQTDDSQGSRAGNCREADADEKDKLLRSRGDSLEDHHKFIKHQMISSMLKI
ncbi:unnamed protein product [Clonostachys rhizophaga]|uniref:Uncharacterized protein n=1 Tax=Clonostachys rhizophaga TaxID=160324 RepID=A0A9N9YHT7_9HYPO|nr:unnamed protein product [Clonostachys rhizophaga]